VLSREAAVTLAVLGAVVSVMASILQAGGGISAERAGQINRAGYGFMAASMLFFIIIGFRS
jgi:hypothetical protein